MLEITLFRHSISKINYTLQIHPHTYMLWKHIYVSQLKNKAIIRHSQHRFIKGRSRLSNLLFSDKVACLVDERNPRESFWILVRPLIPSLMASFWKNWGQEGTSLSAMSWEGEAQREALASAPGNWWHGTKLHQGGWDQILGKIFITVRVVQWFDHWNRLPSVVLDASCLSVSKRHLDNALSNVL